MLAFLDACAIIYWVEMRESQYQQFVDRMHHLRGKYGALNFATSQLSILECRVKPIRERNEQLLKNYQIFFSADDFMLIPMDLAIINDATSLRASYNLSTPDALQAATALSISEELLFITGDTAFKKVPNLQVVII
jgi:predicted nucleic acid-binding protein